MAIIIVNNITMKVSDISMLINKVEICGFKDGKWIRLSGKLVLDDRIEAKKDMLDKNPNLRSMYNEEDDNTAVLYFENAKAVIASFTDEPKIIEF